MDTKLDQKEQFIQLRAKDVPYEKIAKELGVSKPTLIKWGKEFQIEITNRRAFEIELLQEKYFVSRKKRIELLGIRVEKLVGEIEKRDFSDISTDKLIDMLVKLISLLKQEEIPIKLKEKASFEDTLAEITDSYIEWKA